MESILRFLSYVFATVILICALSTTKYQGFSIIVNLCQLTGQNERENKHSYNSYDFLFETCFFFFFIILQNEMQRTVQLFVVSYETALRPKMWPVGQ